MGEAGVGVPGLGTTRKIDIIYIFIPATEIWWKYLRQCNEGLRGMISNSAEYMCRSGLT